MAQIIEQNTEIQVEETQRRLSARRLGMVFPRRRRRAIAPSPSLVGQDQTPTHLAGLADRARGYVEAASSANTRKTYAGLCITACASGPVGRSAS